MKQMYNLEFHSTVCLITFLIIKSCSVVSRPSLNPVCSSFKCLFTPSAILLMTIFPRNLGVVGISVIPLQFPQQVRSPFLAILLSGLFFPVSWSSFVIQYVCLKNLFQRCFKVSFYYFVCNVVISGYLPNFSSLIADWISFTV